jgi:hypothetical protein
MQTCKEVEVQLQAFLVPAQEWFVSRPGNFNHVGGEKKKVQQNSFSLKKSRRSNLTFR